MGSYLAGGTKNLWRAGKLLRLWGVGQPKQKTVGESWPQKNCWWKWSGTVRRGCVDSRGGGVLWVPFLSDITIERGSNSAVCHDHRAHHQLQLYTYPHTQLYTLHTNSLTQLCTLYTYSLTQLYTLYTHPLTQLHTLYTHSLTSHLLKHLLK